MPANHQERGSRPGTGSSSEPSEGTSPEDTSTLDLWPPKLPQGLSCFIWPMGVTTRTAAARAGGRRVEVGAADSAGRRSARSMRRRRGYLVLVYVLPKRRPFHTCLCSAYCMRLSLAGEPGRRSASRQAWRQGPAP